MLNTMLDNPDSDYLYRLDFLHKRDALHDIQRMLSDSNFYEVVARNAERKLPGMKAMRGVDSDDSSQDVHFSVIGVFVLLQRAVDAIISYHKRRESDDNLPVECDYKAELEKTTPLYPPQPATEDKYHV